jgi:hypothetical protein
MEGRELPRVLDDNRLAAVVGAAVRDAIAATTRDVPLGSAVATVTAAVVAAIGGDGDAMNASVARSPERPAERRRRENAAAMVEMDELERQGRRRDAAMIVARRTAINPHDPNEIEMLAQRLRRLRRNETNSVRLRSKKRRRL